MPRRTAVRRRSSPVSGRLRAAQTVVFSVHAGELLGFNFLSRQEFRCDPDLLDFVRSTKAWASMKELAGDGPQAIPLRTLEALVGIGVLIEEGSEAARREERFLAQWKWGFPTALMHFCLDGASYLSLEQSGLLQLEKAKTVPSPRLWLCNDGLSEVHPLEPALGRNSLLSLMAARRTVREAAGVIALRELADCLFAGMGITGQTQNCVGTLPLSMTPSGGARNPFEAYVFARAVAGLSPGIYHYSAAEHSLGRISDKPCPDLAELTGGQDWARDKPALVVLAAFLERPMWKYEDGNAYRVMLIEAGHIGQNIMLAATAHGLTACPTAALNHNQLRTELSLDSVIHAPLYALGIGRQ